jgi:hypothetical protein
MQTSLGNQTNSSSISVPSINMSDQIDASYQEQDVFFGLNSTVIVFYPPNQPPMGPIRVIFGGSSDVLGQQHDYGVLESLQSNGYPAVGMKLNVSEVLTLVDPRFTEQYIVTEKNYAIGIFYCPGFSPQNFLLSKHIPFQFTVIGTMPATSVVTSSIYRTVNLHSTITIVPSLMTYHQLESSMTAVSTRTAYQTVSTTAGLVNHITATLGCDTQDGDIASRIEPVNSFSGNTTNTTMTHASALSAENNFHYPPHNNRGDLGTIFAGILGTLGVIGLICLAWRYVQKERKRKRKERLLNLAAFGKEISESRASSLYNCKIAAAKKAYQSANMMDSGTQTDEILDGDYFLNSKTRDEPTPKNWPPLPYNYPTSSAGQISIVYRSPVCEKETVRYSPSYQHPTFLPSSPPPLPIPARTTKRMTRWESFESPDALGIKIYDLKGFM